MIPRFLTLSSVELCMLSSSTALNNERKTFLFRSRLPQTNVQSPYADPTRTKVKVQNEVFITVESPEEDIASDSSNSSFRSFTKSTMLTKKFSSFNIDSKVI
ncbi:unnamed protein product [Cercopithifilaria johnstoni]|uniref:Uncharacterized protein n=1 Tax=Cercopithifilaria johnstoni TaxID=2874296 RepID=A0A8J2QB47_9BILA|nr:unnamed protein product [Cercopithifilaria johnstoni]